MTQPMYLVWSNEHAAWWKPDHCGYTTVIARAGRYSRAEALKIAGTRDGGWHVLPSSVTGFIGLPRPSGTSNRGKNHVAGRLDEWGGSSNPFRGTDLGRLHLPSFECWTMGIPVAWVERMRFVTRSSPRSRKASSNA